MSELPSLPASPYPDVVNLLLAEADSPNGYSVEELRERYADRQDFGPQLRFSHDFLRRNVKTYRTRVGVNSWRYFLDPNGPRKYLAANDKAGLTTSLRLHLSVEKTTLAGTTHLRKRKGVDILPSSSVPVYTEDTKVTVCDSPAYEPYTPPKTFVPRSGSMQFMSLGSLTSFKKESS